MKQRLKKRIKFLNNFQKITKSVSLISAVRFQKNILRIRRIILNVFYFLSITNQLVLQYPQIFDKKKKEEGNYLVVVVSSDRGLAGSFDQLIFKKTESIIQNLAGKNFFLGVLGRRGVNHFRQKYSLEFSYQNFENFLPENLAKEMFNYLNFLINNKNITDIYFIRSNLTPTGFFVETLKIFPYTLETLEELIEKVLPKMKEWEKLKIVEIKKEYKEYIFEPTIQKIIKLILANVFYLVLYILILESQASLELTRTITMKKASENSKEIKNKAILQYNKLRQQKITEELIDLLRI
ncbi:MAG: F0F1 ATP synthase subunit gamma [Patescibacteria group bacterium]|nr:F0F1 ATP synthase subunit gamma [Patescibacteria group bacterium]